MLRLIANLSYQMRKMTSRWPRLLASNAMELRSTRKVYHAGNVVALEFFHQKNLLPLPKL
jgi:hypothetical protein